MKKKQLCERMKQREIDFYRENINTLTWAKLARRFHRSVPGLKKALAELGIHRDPAATQDIIERGRFQKGYKKPVISNAYRRIYQLAGLL